VRAERADPMLFAVEVTRGEAEAVLVLHGELDLCGQPQFVAALAKVEGRFPRVVLDLAELTFIDAGNIGVIYRACRAAKEVGGEIVLRSANPHLFRILELTGLPTFSSHEELRPIVLPLPSRAYERLAL